MLTCFIGTEVTIMIIVIDKPSLKLFLGITISFIQLLSLINFQRVQYGNPVLHSISYLCVRH